ncbi:MAG: hypothetical protein PHD83_02220 [Caldisericia bacterium]|nr:hypothetical protein [Caldisericia bacterium]
MTSRDWGLMQVNDSNFQNLKYKGIFSNLQGFWKNDLWKSNPFANIGAGMGEQFYLFTAPEYYKNEPNTLSTWQKIGLTYNTGVKYTTESYFNAINYNGDDKDYIHIREYGKSFNRHLLKNLGRRY